MHKQVLRPKRVYNMLASRACRSSIMIGRDLDAKVMRTVVNNLSTLESPWNCPHGRPTLRFLHKLGQGTKLSDIAHKRARPPPRLLTM